MLKINIMWYVSAVNAFPCLNEYSLYDIHMRIIIFIYMCLYYLLLWNNDVEKKSTFKHMVIYVPNTTISICGYIYVFLYIVTYFYMVLILIF